MVQVEISQLTAECTTWRDALRNYRDQLTSDKNQLQQAASASLSKDQLQTVEHLHNQLHIQLINIHDLRHAIKTHYRLIEMDMSSSSGQVRDELLAEHENLFDQYQSLDSTLQSVQAEFDEFLSSTS